jgi:glycosyltransferase involved in cell wall biosynthesis
MQAADVFVMTSLWEGLPLVLLEAMAAGLPAIAFEIPGVAEVLTEGESGLMVPVGDTATFADRLRDLAGNKSRLTAMSEASKTRVANEFGFEQYMTKLIEKYRDISAPVMRGN